MEMQNRRGDKMQTSANESRTIAGRPLRLVRLARGGEPRSKNIHLSHCVGPLALCLFPLEAEKPEQLVQLEERSGAHQLERQLPLCVRAVSLAHTHTQGSILFADIKLSHDPFSRAQSFLNFGLQF